MGVVVAFSGLSKGDRKKVILGVVQMSILRHTQLLLARRSEQYVLRQRPESLATPVAAHPSKSFPCKGTRVHLFKQCLLNPDDKFPSTQAKQQLYYSY